MAENEHAMPFMNKKPTFPSRHICNNSDKLWKIDTNADLFRNKVTYREQIVHQHSSKNLAKVGGVVDHVKIFPFI